MSVRHPMGELHSFSIKNRRRSGVSIVNLEHISHFVPMFLFLTLNI